MEILVSIGLFYTPVYFILNLDSLSPVNAIQLLLCITGNFVYFEKQLNKPSCLHSMLQSLAIKKKHYVYIYWLLCQCVMRLDSGNR